MWKFLQHSDTPDRIIELHLHDDQGEVSHRRFLELLAEEPAFRAFFNDALAALPFTGFRWETPEADPAKLDRPFECAVINDPRLDRALDRSSFAEHFQQTDTVIAFMNLGKNGLMIVPTPSAQGHGYGHLARFVREAPPEVRDHLWRMVGEETITRSKTPMRWLSTAGGGVSWLHVRLDSRPKYYNYEKYKRSSAAPESESLRTNIRRQRAD